MSFYTEATAAQPGRQAGSAELEAWFWDETAASRVLFALQDELSTDDDPYSARVAKLNIVPFAQRARNAPAA